MTEKHIVARPDFDRLLNLFAQFLGIPSEAADEAVEASYPISTPAAVKEARHRGVDATEHRARRFIETHPDLITKVGRTLAWSKAAVDQFVDELAEVELLTPEAAERKQHGRAAEDDVERIALELERELKLKKRRRAQRRAREHVQGQAANVQAN